MDLNSASAFAPASPLPPVSGTSVHHRVLVDDLLAAEFTSPTMLHILRETFCRRGYVRLPSLIRADILAILQCEMRRLKTLAIQQDFVMEAFQSPRQLAVLGGSRIETLSPTLASLYAHHDVRLLVSAIAGRTVFSCRHPEEFMVANFLMSSGDTHGWHLDDPAYALVIVLEAPPREAGGLLEFIPGWRFLQAETDGVNLTLEQLVTRARDCGLVQVHHHDAGDAYLLKADDCLHRVTELRSASVCRSVLNLAFQADRSLAYGETATLLYGSGGI